MSNPGGVKQSEPGPLDLDEVARRHGGLILRRCRAILRDQAEAEDAAQEVFVTLIRKGHRFRGEADITSFLYRVSTNVCLNRIRASKRRKSRENSTAVASWMGAPQQDPYARYRATERVAALADTLDSEELSLFIYRALDGLSLDEIASVTGRSRKTIAKKLNKITPLLEETFAPEAP